MLMGTDFQRSQSPELWGGIECTINRVNNEYFDQLELSGHYQRSGDLACLASTGIRSIRYPVLWELHQQFPGQQPDWTWAEKQLNEIRRLNMIPIVGLLHHGSGPQFTDLTDPAFPVLMADYAGKLAEKFPWIDYYTPVNEPLTTARFSGLYGFWYPHHQTDRSFLKILMNQIKATVLSMQAIRRINPAARLIQTEDLAKIHSSPLLQYQADFENERRWLTYDLLCGKLQAGHPLWQYMLQNGIAETELRFLIENPCPPDIMGLNYYITSERYLDEEVSGYPDLPHEGNGKHRYADTEAVRAPFPCRAGARKLIAEAWERYHLPIAITEAHINCTVEEQMRWFHEIWTACCNSIADGVDLRAVTAWSMLGAYNWSNLLTRNEREYETGVFDTTHGDCCPTSIVQMLRALSETGTFEHPALEGKGWWHYQAGRLSLTL
jgi:dTDP-4-dehydrorhamnose reductase